MPNPAQTTHPTKSGFLRLPQILQLIPIGRSTWWAGVASGKYPKGVKLGKKTTAWRVDEINELIEKLSKEG
jgi:predicted DNA-binding transcriptional regulator AlpA